MDSLKPEGFICKVKSLPQDILSLFVTLQQGVGLRDGLAISHYIEQSSVYQEGFHLKL